MSTSVLFSFFWFIISFFFFIFIFFNLKILHELKLGSLWADWMKPHLFIPSCFWAIGKTFTVTFVYLFIYLFKIYNSSQFLYFIGWYNFNSLMFLVFTPPFLLFFFLRKEKVKLCFWFVLKKVSNLSSFHTIFSCSTGFYILCSACLFYGLDFFFLSKPYLLWQERAKSLKLPTHITIDAGRTQIAPSELQTILSCRLILVCLFIQLIDFSTDIWDIYIISGWENKKHV